MGADHRHRRGSLAFRPRKRSRSENPRVLAWPNREENKLLGFAGYKAGMTQVVVVDNKEGSGTYQQEIVVPATILSCPPLFVLGVRAYRAGYAYEETFFDVFSDPKTWDKNIKRAIPIPKNLKHNVEELDQNASKIRDVYILAATMPAGAGFGRKKPDVIEIAVGGKDVAQKLNFAKGILGKTIKASDVLKQGEFVDTISVTKGKGWQGVIKRFGVKMQRRKATGRYRHVGTLGPFHPAKVMYTAKMAGQMGYHKRTISNIQVLDVGSNGKNVTPKGGFIDFGVVNGDYVLLKGSVAGPKKRLIKMRVAMHKSNISPMPIKSISTISQQGM